MRDMANPAMDDVLMSEGGILAKNHWCSTMATGSLSHYIPLNETTSCAELPGGSGIMKTPCMDRHVSVPSCSASPSETMNENEGRPKRNRQKTDFFASKQMHGQNYTGPDDDFEEPRRKRNIHATSSRAATEKGKVGDSWFMEIREEWRGQGYRIYEVEGVIQALEPGTQFRGRAWVGDEEAKVRLLDMTESCLHRCRVGVHVRS
jgi:hypothetical protein